jgi:predicted DNA-binding protein
VTKDRDRFFTKRAKPRSRNKYVTKDRDRFFTKLSENRDRRKKYVTEDRDRYFTDKIGGSNCCLFGREDYFMIKAINLTESIEERLLAICQQIGCQENELIEEAILNYLEDFEDSQDANDRLSNRPENYLTLAEVEQELGLANRV